MWKLTSRTDPIRRRLTALSGPQLRRVALPLACALFVAIAALTALAAPAVAGHSVQLDGAGVVTSVEVGSDAWADGIRPGWTVVAQSPGTTVYAGGGSIIPVTDDLTKRDPGPVVVPPLALLVLAGAAYALGLRRTSTTLAVVAAALIDPAFAPRFGVVGWVCAGVPIALAAGFLGQISQMAGLPKQWFWRVASWVVIPAGAAAAAAARDSVTTAFEYAAFGLLSVAWLIVLRWRVANASLVAGSTSRLAVARAVALETVPFASRLRNTGAQAERDRLASDLHAEVLPAIASRAEELERRGDTASAEVLRDLAHDVRDLVSARRLPILEDEGLIAAAEWLAESLESRAGIEIEIDLAGDTGARPPLVVERAAYRVLQLALDNVIKHAAASKAVVAIAASARSLRLAVTDDGRGLEPGEAVVARRRGHLGLADMRAEAEAIGGALAVDRFTGSSPSGSADGTRISFEWPA
jgi:signal transduction histidine kinase